MGLGEYTGRGTLEGWQWNLAVDEKVRRLWRRIAVLGKGR
jgi:hypothetical protein